MSKAELKPLLTEHVQESERVVRAIKRAQGSFALFFVECNSHDLRHQVADSVASSLDVSPLMLDAAVLAQGEMIPLDAWISDQVKDAPENAAIFLFGLAHLLPSSNQEKLHKQMQSINWRRNAFARLNRPLVIWLPSYAMSLLAEHTSDFYDWYSGSYQFKMDGDARELELNHFQQSVRTDSGLPAVNRMSTLEKKTRVQLILELLEEHPSMDKAKLSLYAELGSITDSQGKYEQALKHWQKALQISQAISDKLSEGTILNNISQTFHEQSDYATALDYLQRSLAIRQDIGDKSGEGAAFNNISRIYDAQGDYVTALDYLQRSLAISQDIGDKSVEGATLNNMSQVFQAQSDYATALDYLQRSLVINQGIGDKSGICITLFNMGYIYWQDNQQQEAISVWLEVYGIAKEMGHAQVLGGLNALAKQLGEDGLAFWETLSKQQALKVSTGEK